MYWFAVNTKLNLAIYEVRNAFESQQFSAFFFVLFFFLLTDASPYSHVENQGSRIKGFELESNAHC